MVLATVWSAAPGLVARVNVVDLRHDRIVADREYVNLTPLRRRTTTIRAGGYVVSWRPRSPWGVWSLAASPTGGLASLPTPALASQGALTLRLVPEQPYVLHGTHGIIRQGLAPSAYYSAPRLAVAGTLVADGRRLAVHGQGWFDHQWVIQMVSRGGTTDFDHLSCLGFAPVAVFDPPLVKIRRSLASDRARGMAFKGSWERAKLTLNWWELREWDPILRATRSVWQSAYYREPTTRSLAEARDVLDARDELAPPDPPSRRIRMVA